MLDADASAEVSREKVTFFKNAIFEDDIDSFEGVDRVTNINVIFVLRGKFFLEEGERS